MFAFAIALVFLFGILSHVRVFLLPSVLAQLTDATPGISDTFHRCLVCFLVISIVLIAVLAGRFIASHIYTMASSFIAFQLAFIFLWYVSGPVHQFELRYRLTYDYSNSFSRTRNVLLLVIDSLSAADFDSILYSDSKLEDRFRGFTFYPDSLGAYPYTRGAIPHILTGLFEDNSKPLTESVGGNLHAESIPGLLKKASFRTEAYGFGVPYVLHAPVWDNITDAMDIVPKPFDVSRVIFQFSLKMAPECFHKYLIALWLKAFPRWQGTPYWGILFPAGIYDVSRLEELEEKAVADTVAPVFKYEHFWGGHMPYMLSKRLEFTDPSYAIGNRKAQVGASIELCCRYLEVLKRLEIFDNSMIFIVGDHGVVEQEPFPMMLWKPFHNRQPLRVSSRPVSQADIIKTICDEFGISLIREYGESLRCEKENASIIRRYFTFCGNHLGEPQGYLPELKECLVSGKMDGFMSLIPTFARFTPGRKLLTPRLGVGSVLKFRKDGNYFGYTSVLGWSWPHRDIVWSNGGSAALYLPMTTPGQSMNIAIRCRPFVAGSNDVQQTLRVTNSNKCVLFEGTLLEPTTVVFQVSPDALVGDLLTLQFEFPNAASETNLEFELSAAPSIGFESLTIMR